MTTFIRTNTRFALRPRIVTPLNGLANGIPIG